MKRQKSEQAQPVVRQIPELQQIEQLLSVHDGHNLEEFEYSERDFEDLRLRSPVRGVAGLLPREWSQRPEIIAMDQWSHPKPHTAPEPGAPAPRLADRRPASGQVSESLALSTSLRALWHGGFVKVSSSRPKRNGKVLLHRRSQILDE